MKTVTRVLFLPLAIPIFLSVEVFGSTTCVKSLPQSQKLRDEFLIMNKTLAAQDEIQRSIERLRQATSGNSNDFLCSSGESDCQDCAEELKKLKSSTAEHIQSLRSSIESLKISEQLKASAQKYFQSRTNSQFSQLGHFTYKGKKLETIQLGNSNITREDISIWQNQSYSKYESAEKTKLDSLIAGAKEKYGPGNKPNEVIEEIAASRRRLVTIQNKKSALQQLTPLEMDVLRDLFHLMDDQKVPWCVEAEAPQTDSQRE